MKLKKIKIYTFVFVVFTMTIFMQCSNEPTDYTKYYSQDGETETVTENSSNWLDENMVKLLIPIISGIFSVLSIIVTARLKDIKWRKAYKPKTLKKGARRNSILMIGLGRVGKTQLLDTLTKELPKQKMLNISDYFKIVEYNTSFDNGKAATYYFTDYRGQNFAQLISSFIQEQLKPDTVLRYGDINSLIIFVDLFPQEENRKNLNKTYPKFNKGRVKEHVTTWNNIALDAVFGLLTKKNLKFICLFINKIDKLETKNDEILKEIKNDFEPLIEQLDRRAESSEAEFEVIIGSATEGTKVIGSKSLLYFLNQNSRTFK